CGGLATPSGERALTSRPLFGPARVVDHLGNVERTPAHIGIGELGLAREAVGHDDRARRRVAHPRKQAFLGAPHRDLVVTLLETPRTGEPAASTSEQFGLKAHATEQVELMLHATGRLVVTVTPYE